MENDTQNVENIPVAETSSWITRRKMLQVTAVGSLIAVTGLQIAYRKRRNKTSATTEITIDGPFKEYGYFRPEDLGRNDLKKLNSDFKLETLILDEGKYHDNVMISFTFTGEEDPARKMKVFLTVYDKEGKVVGGAENIFTDPRIIASKRSPISGRLGAGMATATLSARLFSDTKLSAISHVGISAVPIKDI